MKPIDSPMKRRDSFWSGWEFFGIPNANAANVYCHGVNSIILGIQVSKPLLDKPNTMFLEMYPSFILYFMDALEDA
jgi:hypothetical protein